MSAVTSISTRSAPAFLAVAPRFAGREPVVRRVARVPLQFDSADVLLTRRRPPSMLRVQDRRKPDDWDKRNESLSGRFLPLDPSDEVVLDELERAAPGGRAAEDPEGPPATAYGTAASGPKWSKRAEAAKKRWADPLYRAKMLDMRAAKKERDLLNAGGVVGEEKGSPGKAARKKKLQIGKLDSITMSRAEMANAINEYAQSNQRRSEKLASFHRDRATWMARRLSDGQMLRDGLDSDDSKKKRQEERQAVARKRHVVRAKAKAANINEAT
jgi:hypothetical protein